MAVAFPAEDLAVGKRSVAAVISGVSFPSARTVPSPVAPHEQPVASAGMAVRRPLAFAPRCGPQPGPHDRLSRKCTAHFYLLHEVYSRLFDKVNKYRLTG